AELLDRRDHLGVALALDTCCHVPLPGRLPLSRQDAAAIRTLPGWLTTVVGRISLDVLRSRESACCGSWTPTCG
ncbi:MAG: hypothetical protein HOY69_00005, partial [Streptomyces sp.]|nr:hypothetical protein [Streptomyces sp.]